MIHILKHSYLFNKWKINIGVFYRRPAHLLRSEHPLSFCLPKPFPKQELPTGQESEQHWPMLQWARVQATVQHKVMLWASIRNHRN